MAHTFQTTGFTFIYNSDLSGDVEIYNGTLRMKVPGVDLLEFVAEHVRRERIGEIELMSVAELLGLKP